MSQEEDNYVSAWSEMRTRADAEERAARESARREVLVEAIERARREHATESPTKEQVRAFMRQSTDDEVQRHRGRCARWVHDFDAYNASIANALGTLDEHPSDTKGRDRELRQLQAILTRPSTTIALCLGEAGSGKTRLVEEFSKQANSGKLRTHSDNHRYMVMALRLGELSALPRNELQAALANIIPTLYDFEKRAELALNDISLKVILFIDEVHMMVTIFGQGTKIGGDVMKDMLARSPIRVIAATTRREYDSTIAVDKPLAERFKVLELNEVSQDVVREIVDDWWTSTAPDCPPLDSDVRDYLISANGVYRPDDAEPRKSLDTCEDLVSYCRRTGLPATREVVDDVFDERFSIKLGFHIDADKVYNNIASQVFGQPAALRSWRLLLHGLAFKTRQNSNRPIFSALLAGATSTGKTSSVKAIAEALYPGERVLYTINMPDYSQPKDEPLFRKELGETLRHRPNAVILLDEFEKAAENIRRSMLYILDEGLVNFTVMNREGREETNSASLRNAIVICTTNQGADVFKNDAQFSVISNDFEDEGVGELTLEQEMAMVQLSQDLRANLEGNGFPPELLGRFDEIMLYRALSAKTTLKIVRVKLDAMLDDLKRFHGITIDLNPEVTWDAAQYDCFANDVCVYIAFVCAKVDVRDSNAGGARRLDSELQTNVFYRIVQACSKNLECKHFKLGVRGAFRIERGDGHVTWELDNEMKEGIYLEPVIDNEDSTD